MPTSEDEKREVAIDLRESLEEAEVDLGGGPPMLPQMQEDVPNYLDQFDALENDFDEEDEGEMPQEEEQEVDSDVEDIFAQIEGGWDNQGWSGDVSKQKEEPPPPASLFGNVGVTESPATKPSATVESPAVETVDEPSQDQGFAAAMEQLNATERDSNELIALMLRPGLDVVEAVASMLKKPRVRDFAEHMVALLDACNRCHVTVELCIQKDLDGVTDPATILRTESVYCRMSAQFVGHVAKGYISELLTPLLPGVLELELETDENKLDEELSEEQKSATIQANMNNMQEALTSVVTSIQSSESRMPWKVQYVLHAAHSAVKEKFPGKEVPASGSLLFLRNICPALSAPSAAGIEVKIDRSGRRKMILVTKLVQTMANDIILPVDDPDRSDGALNEFVNQQTPQIQQFLARITGTALADPDCEWKLPEDIGEVAEPLMEFLLDNLGECDLASAESSITQEVCEAVKALDEQRRGLEIGVAPGRGSVREAAAAEPDSSRGNGCCVIL